MPPVIRNFRRLLRSMAAVVLSLQFCATSAAGLPPEPQYKGELRGDGKGGVVVVPFGADDNENNADPGQMTPGPGNLQRQWQPADDAGPQAGMAAAISTLHVGPNREIRTVSEAARRARNGDTILLDAGTYPADVAVFTQDRLTIRAVGGRARLAANGASAEGKGIWVIRGGSILVENLEFHGARVPDRNGAGIRFEKGRLTIRNCLFADNENGILTSDGGSELVIENSEFDHNGTVEGRSHQLYVGAIPRLKVSGSYFHNTVGGHLLKSRARQNLVSYNRLTDETGGRASYELEFPNGGIAYVIGNIIEQSPTTDNSAIIAVGMEGMRWPKNELYLVNNTIVDDREAGGIFLKAPPGLHALKAVNNLLVGDRKRDFGVFSEDVSRRDGDTGKFYRPDLGTRVGDSRMTGEIGNNFNPGRNEFAQPSRYDYHLRERASLAGKYVAPGMANGIDLAPRAEYVHPAHTRRLAGTPSYPGALQSPAR